VQFRCCPATVTRVLWNREARSTASTLALTAPRRGRGVTMSISPGFRACPHLGGPPFNKWTNYRPHAAVDREHHNSTGLNWRTNYRPHPACRGGAKVRIGDAESISFASARRQTSLPPRQAGRGRWATASSLVTNPRSTPASGVGAAKPRICSVPRPIIDERSFHGPASFDAAGR
jgi:hypothetical protein